MTRQAAKNRRYRARQRCGVAIVAIPIDQVAIAEAMIASGRLPPAATLERARVTAAITEIVNDWAKRWTAA